MDETRCHEPLQRQIPSTSITQHLVSTFSLLAVQQSVMTQFTESYESQPKATQTRVAGFNPILLIVCWFA